MQVPPQQWIYSVESAVKRTNFFFFRYQTDKLMYYKKSSTKKKLRIDLPYIQTYLPYPIFERVKALQNYKRMYFKINHMNHLDNLESGKRIWKMACLYFKNTMNWRILRLFYSVSSWKVPLLFPYFPCTSNVKITQIQVQAAFNQITGIFRQLLWAEKKERLQ